MRVNGQLEVAQLEQLASDPALSPTGRVYMNIASPAAAIPRVYDGTKWQQFQFSSTTIVRSQNSGQACTVDWGTGLVQEVVLTNHCVISFTNPQAGQIHQLIVTQKAYNTSGNMYQYKLNMSDQDARRQPYQPLGILQASENNVFSWYYSAGIRTAYATTPASIANPVTLPSTAAAGITIHPNGRWIQYGQTTSSPFYSVQEFFDSGAKAKWGRKNASANAAAAAAVVGLEYSPDGDQLFLASATTPFIQGYPVDQAYGNTGTVYSNPGTLPTGAGQCIAMHPNGTHVGIGHTTTPFMSLYPISHAGFGTKLTNPATLPAAQVNSLAFASTGDYLAGAGQTTPFLQVWPFDPIAGTIGTILANPTSLPAGGPAGSLGKGVSWRPQADFIALCSTTSAQVYVTGFNRVSGAFTGVQLTDAAGANANCCAWTPDGQYLIVGFNASPWMKVYDFSNQTLTTSVSFDVASPGVAVTDITIHPSGYFMVLSLSSSPFVMCYPLPYKTRNYMRI